MSDGFHSYSASNTESVSMSGRHRKYDDRDLKQEDQYSPVELEYVIIQFDYRGIRLWVKGDVRINQS